MHAKHLSFDVPRAIGTLQSAHMRIMVVLNLADSPNAGLKVLDGAPNAVVAPNDDGCVPNATVAPNDGAVVAPNDDCCPNCDLLYSCTRVVPHCEQ